jgi:predicted peptidase
VKRTFLIAAGLLALTACASAQPSADSTSHSMQMAKLFKFHQTNTSELKYLLFLPKGYNPKSDQRWPLMLFLHGAGERGSDVWQVTRHGPPKHIVEHPEFPFILVSPQCPQDQIWSNDSLLALLDEITRDYAVDTHRVYLTGLSMGGYGTWNLGLTYPERFAAIVPICGGGELITILLATQQKADALKTLGIWAFHGGKDPVVPTEESQRMVEFAKKAGVKEVKLTIYPEALHDSWTETYNNPELYDWLLRHVRK